MFKSERGRKEAVTGERYAQHRQWQMRCVDCLSALVSVTLSKMWQLSIKGIFCLSDTRPPPLYSNSNGSVLLSIWLFESVKLAWVVPNWYTEPVVWRRTRIWLKSEHLPERKPYLSGLNDTTMLREGNHNTTDTVDTNMDNLIPEVLLSCACPHSCLSLFADAAALSEPHFSSCSCFLQGAELLLSLIFAYSILFLFL